MLNTSHLVIGEWYRSEKKTKASVRPRVSGNLLAELEAIMSQVSDKNMNVHLLICQQLKPIK